MAKNTRDSKKKQFGEGNPTNERPLKSSPKVLIARQGKSIDGNFQRIIIFCEGETEDNYFNGIGESQTLKKRDCPHMEVIVLYPDGKIGLERKQLPKSDSKSSNKKSKLPDRKSDPVNLLLSALKALNTRIEKEKFEPEFDKIWVVFDADGNEEKIAPLFNAKGAKEKLLAKDANCATIFKNLYQHLNIALSNRAFDNFYRQHLNIALSNRAFEHWILLHFERNCTSFPKTECKTNQGEKKQPHGCGKLHRDTDESQYTDCKGSTCTVGYLRNKQYHPNYKKGDWRKRKNKDTKDKKDTSYCYEGLIDSSRLGDLAKEKLAFQKMRNAIENAEYLRQMVGDKRPKTNPYTDIDRLVGAIIGYQPIIYWTNWNEWKEISDKSHHFCVRLAQNKNTIELTIEQKHTKPLLLNNNSLQVGVFYNDERFYRHCKVLPTNIVTKELHLNETTTVSLPSPLDVLPNTVCYNPTYCLKIGTDINIWLPL